MLSRVQLKNIAKQVAQSMLIGRKRNGQGIAQARKVFPRIDSFLSAHAGRVLSEKQLSSAGVTPRIRDKLLYPDWGPILAKRGNGYAVRDTIGESVRIRFHPDNWPLARELILECTRRGAHASFTDSDSAFARELMEESSVESLEDFPALSQSMLKSVDVTIYIEDEDDPEWKRGLSLAKLRAGQEVGQRAHEILDDRKVRWLVLGWPFEKAAKEFGMKLPEYSRMLFASLEESFSRRTRETVSYYERVLSGADHVHIVHEDGSNLHLRVTGRPPLKDVGYLSRDEVRKGDVGLNLPSGETFISPLETSANGRITFEHVHVHGHGFAHGLTLEFKNGRVEKYWARSGRKFLDDYLAENTPSTRTIAELGIGANRAAKFSGYLLTDEKIFGTIHIAIGNNTGAYHGKNKASGHLDMVKDMTRGKMFVDGRLVMSGGKPLSR